MSGITASRVISVDEQLATLTIDGSGACAIHLEFEQDQWNGTSDTLYAIGAVKELPTGMCSRNIVCARPAAPLPVLVSQWAKADEEFASGLSYVDDDSADYYWALTLDLSGMPERPLGDQRVVLIVDSLVAIEPTRYSVEQVDELPAVAPSDEPSGPSPLATTNSIQEVWHEIAIGSLGTSDEYHFLVRIRPAGDTLDPLVFTNPRAYCIWS